MSALAASSLRYLVPDYIVRRIKTLTLNCPGADSIICPLMPLNRNAPVQIFYLHNMEMLWEYKLKVTLLSMFFGNHFSCLDIHNMRMSLLVHIIIMLWSQQTEAQAKTGGVQQPKNIAKNYRTRQNDSRIYFQRANRSRYRVTHSSYPAIKAAPPPSSPSPVHPCSSTVVVDMVVHL